MVAQRARRAGVAPTLPSGAVDPAALEELGACLPDVFALPHGPMSLSMSSTLQSAPDRAEQIARLWAEARRMTKQTSVGWILLRSRHEPTTSVVDDAESTTPPHERSKMAGRAAIAPITPTRAASSRVTRAIAAGSMAITRAVSSAQREGACNALAKNAAL